MWRRKKAGMASGVPSWWLSSAFSGSSILHREDHHWFGAGLTAEEYGVDGEEFGGRFAVLGAIQGFTGSNVHHEMLAFSTRL